MGSTGYSLPHSLHLRPFIYPIRLPPSLKVKHILLYITQYFKEDAPFLINITVAWDSVFLSLPPVSTKELHALSRRQKNYPVKKVPYPQKKRMLHVKYLSPYGTDKDIL